MKNHTPTPWKQVDLSVYGTTKRKGEVLDSYVCNCDSDDHNLESEDKANAEFIVRAVNSHGALLEIAKITLGVLEGSGEFQSGPLGRHAGLEKLVNEAIAKAEGK